MLPGIAKRIDDLVYDNYNIVTLQHQHRVVIQRDHASNYEYQESDYVDARETYSYDASAFAFKTITSAADLKTLQGINRVFARAVKGNTVPLAQLRRLLTAAQFAQYTEDVNSQRHPAEIDYGDGMPTELKRYNIMLRDADFMNNRYESMSSRARLGLVKFNRNSITNASNKAESMYEDALEYLEELYSVATPHERYQLDKWFDRAVDFERGIERTVGIEPESIPRVRGSKSSNALDSGLPKLSKRLKHDECALMVLLEVCCEIAFVLPVTSEEPVMTDAQAQLVKTKLQQLLARNHDDD